ncbi:hypothetical protein ACEWY4_017551 [Coilia grayii]|uniref:Cadherin domain-containing protein n=1 Tax=Coilia grayii TaxID=363190 RepID=A0ABD1JH66_9TELE
MCITCWVWTVLLLGLTFADSIQGLPAMLSSEYQENVLIDSRTGVITVRKELDHEKTNIVILVIQASLENNSQKTADATVTVGVEDVQEPPVFCQEVYTAEIWGVVPLAYSVVEVKATDPDEGETQMLQYFLVEPSSLFAVEPSSGQVVVMSTLQNGTVTLKVKVTDPHGLYDTATVEVTVVIIMRDFVQISINQPFDRVMSRVLETASALQGGLGLQVTIMNVTSVSGGNTVVSFIATDTNGAMVTPEDIKTHSPGDEFATVNTKKPLDAEALGEVNNIRSLRVKDINDNAPIFEKDVYEVQVPEVVVEVKDVNEPPVFSHDVYTAVIDRVVPIGYPVVVVKATDPDVGESERLQYSLVEPNSLFAVEPSSGQVYVVSDIKDSRKETLKVKATDPNGLYNTTTVEVTVVVDTSNVVKISINKPAETVMSRLHETERALQRGLGLEVKIVNVTSSSGDVLARATFLRSVAVVSFIAMDTGGNIVSSQDVKITLKNNEEKVQAELQEVLGADTQFEIVDEGKQPGPDNTLPIVLGTVIPVIVIAVFLAGICYTPGEAQATVNTKKPLDAEALTENSGALTYSIVCMNTTVSNMRTLPVTDMNDNGPVFEKDVYSVRVSEVLPVGGFVVQVKATDADVSPVYNSITYSIEVGVFHTITPAPIKAYGEDAENNQVIIYNISTVHPSDYWENFIIDSTGVITVQKELDHEKTNIVTLGIQASLENDKEKTAIAMARDPDVGDKLHYSLVEPSSLFDVDSYTGLIYAVSAIYSGEETLKVKATDQHGLYAITKVEVTVDIDPGNVVRIVINKPADTVMDLVRETEKALQKALGLKVMIIDITSTSTGDVLVSFMATDTTGSVVTSDNLKNDLRNNKDKVQAELQGVFGPDTDFDIVEESRPNKTLAIILGTLIPLICIVTILSVVIR